MLLCCIRLSSQRYRISLSFITTSSTHGRTCSTSSKPFLPLPYHNIWLFSLFPGWCPVVSNSKVLLYSDIEPFRRSVFHNCLLFLFLPFMFSWSLVLLLVSIRFPTILCLKLGVGAWEDDQKESSSNTVLLIRQKIMKGVQTV